MRIQIEGGKGIDKLVNMLAFYYNTLQDDFLHGHTKVIEAEKNGQVKYLTKLPIIAFIANELPFYPNNLKTKIDYKAWIERVNTYEKDTALVKPDIIIQEASFFNLLTRIETDKNLDKLQKGTASELTELVNSYIALGKYDPDVVFYYRQENNDAYYHELLLERNICLKLLNVKTETFIRLSNEEVENIDVRKLLKELLYLYTEIKI